MGDIFLRACGIRRWSPSLPVESAMGMKFGDPRNPLLVSVRSGARVSMPGMMDTVLNIGLNDETVQGLIRKTSNPRFAYDSYRRFVAMFGDVVLGVPKEEFEGLLSKRKLRWASAGYRSEGGRSQDLVAVFKDLVRQASADAISRSTRWNSCVWASMPCSDPGTYRARRRIPPAL